MNCQQIAALGALASAELLPQSKREGLERHLAGCDSCRRQAERLREACAALGQPGAPFDTAARWSELLPRLAEEPKAPAPTPDEPLAIHIALACCYCHGALERESAVYCASCLSPHHGECFAGHQTCAAPGCGEALFIRPEAQPQIRRRRRAVPWLGALAAATAASVATLAIERRAAPSPSSPVPARAEAPVMPPRTISPALTEAAASLFEAARENWRIGAVKGARESLTLIRRALPSHVGARHLMALIDRRPEGLRSPYPRQSPSYDRYEQRREQVIEEARWAEFLVTEGKRAAAIEALQSLADSIGRDPDRVFLADLEAAALVRLAAFGRVREGAGRWGPKPEEDAAPIPQRLAESAALQELFEARIKLLDSEAELRLASVKEELQVRQSEELERQRSREKSLKLELARLGSERVADNAYFERILERGGLKARFSSPRQLSNLAAVLDDSRATPEERRVAAGRLAITDCGGRWTLDALRRAATRDPDLEVRISSLRALSRLGSQARSAVAAVLEANPERAAAALATPSLGGYEEAWLRALGAIGLDSDGARARLITAAAAAVPRAHRLAAIDGLGELGRAWELRRSRLGKPDLEVQRRLRQQRVDLHFDQLPFEQCLDFLREISGLTIRMSAATRERLLAEKAQVSLRLRSISLGNALRLVISGVPDLEYLASDGAVVLSFKGDSEDLDAPAARRCAEALKEIRAALILAVKDSDSKVQRRGSQAIRAILAGDGGEGGR